MASSKTLAALLAGALAVTACSNDQEQYESQDSYTKSQSSYNGPDIHGDQYFILHNLAKSGFRTQFLARYDATTDRYVLQTNGAFYLFKDSADQDSMEVMRVDDKITDLTVHLKTAKEGLVTTETLECTDALQGKDKRCRQARKTVESIVKEAENAYPHN